MTDFYAGKIILQPSAVARLRIHDRYSLHRVVLDLFPQLFTEVEEGRYFQWVDRGEHLTGREILFLATRTPVIHSLAEDVQVLVKKLPVSFLNHSYYRVRMDVNPTKCVLGKRVPVIEEDLEDWICKKARRSGFVFQDLRVGKFNKVRFRKSESVVTLTEVRIDGILRVIDKERFVKTVVSGFGRGKAFGLGLMQLIPINI